MPSTLALDDQLHMSLDSLIKLQRKQKGVKPGTGTDAKAGSSAKVSERACSSYRLAGLRVRTARPQHVYEWSFALSLVFIDAVAGTLFIN